MNRERKIRVVIAKPGLDGHDRGAKIIARALWRRRHGGHLHGSPPDPGADRRDGDPGGRRRGRHLHPLGGAHDARPQDSRRAEGRTASRTCVVVVGGTIPKPDVEELKRQGVAEVFTPGAPVSEIVEFLRERVPVTPVSVDVARDGGVAVVTVNRPDAMNALDVEHAEALRDHLEDLAADPEARVVLLTGAGDKAFVAGADIKYMQSLGVLEAAAGASSARRAPTSSRRFPSRPSRRSTATRSAAAASSRSPATSASPPTRRSWASRRSTSASSRAGAEASACRASSGSASPRRSSSQVARSARRRRTTGAS